MPLKLTRKAILKCIQNTVTRSIYNCIHVYTTCTDRIGTERSGVELSYPLSQESNLCLLTSGLIIEKRIEHYKDNK